MKNVYKKIGSWIAIFAMLLTSFMPLISHAIESQNNLDNQERICTSQGIKFVSTQNDSLQYFSPTLDPLTLLKPRQLFNLSSNASLVHKFAHFFYFTRLIKCL